MPRTGPRRTITAEHNLARRIKLEREKREWTYEATARRLTSVGCPTLHSAVYKMERLSDPPRRITANELAAFALIFRISETELLRNPEAAEDERLHELLQGAETARAAAESAMLAWLRARRSVGIHLHRSERGAADGRLAAVISEIGAPMLLDVGWPAGERTSGEAWDAADRDVDENGDGDLMPQSDAEAVRDWLTS